MGKKAEKKRQARTKSVLTFDEDARKEWLTSFSKRKKERQTKAKNDIAAALKEEKLRQRAEHRETVKKHEKKFLARLEDVNMILKEKTKEYDCGGKTVEITEYNLTAGDDMIGTNAPVEERDEKGEMESSEQVKEENGYESDESDTNPGLIRRKMPKQMTKTAVKLEKKLYRLTNKREGRKKKKKGVDTLKGRKIKDKRASVRGKRKV